MEKSLKFVPNCPQKSVSQHKMEELEEEEITASNLNQVSTPTPCISNFSQGFTTTIEIEQSEVEVAEGYTITQFCDKIIDLLVFTEEWRKYSENVCKQCKARTDAGNDNGMKQKLVLLGRKVKKIDKEIEGHSDLLKEIEHSPTDINAVRISMRKISRLGARCLSAICTLDAAQAKFNDILNPPVVYQRIKSLGKAKALDSSLILLINNAWDVAKEYTTMKNEVKDIMHHLYKSTKSILRSIAPKEIKLLKHLLNITYPEERFSALATSFSPGDENVDKDPNALYTRKEMYKWIKIMLNAYHLNKEVSEIMEARQLTLPIAMQRLLILKETIKEEYLLQITAEEDSKPKKL
ncbi:hypothetical protein MKX03_015812 [Papaver bracteatum]|nr:hypothetical protein MKX03_015812 [Papaver bracteatum]